MRLSLIGMSGAGKSYWSGKMEGLGYQKFCCDELIAERLGPVLQRKGKATVDLAEWMGWPDSEGYSEAQALYLKLEGDVIALVCDELEKTAEKNTPVVVDTTGSLIYLEKKLLNRLRAQTLTVHLDLPSKKHEQLFEAYLQDPKPVVWEGKYLPREGESPQNTLSRCYRELLSFRNERYRAMADCILDYSFHHSSGTCLEELLDQIGKRSLGSP